MKLLLTTVAAISLLACDLQPVPAIDGGITPSPSDASAPAKDPCAMQLVRGINAVAVKPADPDPNDPEIQPPGWFAVDPSDPPTQLPAEWANQVQGEITGLIGTFGGVPTDNTVQLSELCEQGSWNPLLVEDGQTGAPNIAYTIQNGWYHRVGRLVVVHGALGWQNSGDAASIAAAARVILPYRVEQFSNFVQFGGDVDYPTTVLVEPAGFDAKAVVQVRLGGFDPTVATFTALDNLADSPATADIGSAQQDVRFRITYMTDGVKQAEANPTPR